MGKFIDLAGERFSKLIVVGRSGTGNTGQSIWLCKCDCGKETNVLSDNLRRGKQVSCGCYLTERRVTHGMTKTKEYTIWQGLRERCNNPNKFGYKDYGGRGIKVCERWDISFENFYADMGERPSPGHSIDRIDVNGDYKPTNCRWATQSEQNLNRRVGKITSSGHIGVAWNEPRKKWLAYIDMPNDGKRISLGGFTTIEDAINARKKAEIERLEALAK
jgi:hypothetical protein